MALSWKEFKDAIRQQLWPSGESAQLVAAHDKFFIDAMIDLQTCVPCLQQDNTSQFPQCSTLYNCGLTFIENPVEHGIIKRVSVVDQINSTTRKEDATAAIDWCSELAYNEVDYCHVHSFLDYSRRRGCCGNIGLFFGFRRPFPAPTDVGVPPGLPLLPLGYHYPQASTDRRHGRAGMGIWAKQRGNIFIAPWIQSTEMVEVVWDGKKTKWNDADLIDDDPLLSEGVREYVRWKHADIYDQNPDDAGRAHAAYHGNPGLGIIGAREKLIHQCREETRVRECEPSHARQATVTSLFYNEDQSATASCDGGFTGNPVTVTIPAGTVGSALSKADADQRAKDQAQTQANAQLVCTAIPVTYLNDAPQTATASCQGVEGSPPPEGVPITITVAAGTVTSTVSVADANAQALAQAQAAAQAQLICTFWNAAQSFTAVCPDNGAITLTKNVAAHTYSSPASQADADAQAYNAAKNQAETAIVCGGTVFYNDPYTASATRNNCARLTPGGATYGSVTVNVTVAAHAFSSLLNQTDANVQAMNQALQLATYWANIYCGNGAWGVHQVNFP
jgi:hypothetical protein